MKYMKGIYTFIRSHSGGLSLPGTDRTSQGVRDGGPQDKEYSGIVRTIPESGAMTASERERTLGMQDHRSRPVREGGSSVGATRWLKLETTIP